MLRITNALSRIFSSFSLLRRAAAWEASGRSLDLTLRLETANTKGYFKIDVEPLQLGVCVYGRGNKKDEKV